MSTSAHPQRTASVIGRSTGVGLDRDAALVASLLGECGMQAGWHHPRALPFWRRLPLPVPPGAELVVFLERVFPAWCRTAGRSVLIPNQERFPHRHLGRLKRVDAVFCKTHHAVEVFARHHGNVHHLGFTSEDRRDPGIAPDYRRFFHLAGSSTLKGTEDLLEVWSRHPDWPTLTVVIHPNNAPQEVAANVNLISRRLGEDELRQLQNANGIHLCPSRSEGWGHYIAEALSCGAVTVTTDGPPMNELVGPDRGVLVAAGHREPRHLGTNFHVDPEALEAAIQQLLETPAEQLAELGNNARRWFLDNDRAFRQRFLRLTTELLSSPTP